MTYTLRNVHFRLISQAFICALLLCVVFGANTHATYRDDNGKILYRTSDDNVLHLSDPDGSNDTIFPNITDGAYLSPNGNFIVSTNYTGTNFTDIVDKKAVYQVPIFDSQARLFNDGLSLSYINAGDTYVGKIDGSSSYITSSPANSLIYSPDGSKAASVTYA